MTAMNVYDIIKIINLIGGAVCFNYLEFVKQDNPVTKFYSIIKQDYWQCVCGFVNIGKVCRSCNMKKTDVFQFTREQIAGTYNKYLIQVEERKKKEEQVRLEAEQIVAEEEKK